ncbi:Fatty acid desaturase [Macleaya cordata]|uniref:Fatty acid desaturase n=1 Tax=Macleaya cordata TaxID=56857 RepID=A0A200QZW9_MACCD|nr:Fatty acid desaturase [Macleaya cordata]
MSTSTANEGAASMMMRRRKLQQQVVFWKRKWAILDAINLGIVVLEHIAILFAPFNFSWDAFWVAVILHMVTSFGITLSYHINLTHKSFKLPKWLEYLFAYCGLHAGEGHPIYWISYHRYHHQFTDTDRDPHSPIEGFWFSHVNWLFDHSYINEKCGGEANNVMDLQKQAYYRFLQSTYYLHLLGLGLLLYVVGGFPYVIWGMGVRMAIAHQSACLVNSVCHTWGQKPWNTKDLSKNNWLMGLIAFGEGWHNNHHAFEFSARHGLEWWQIDVTWYLVKLLEYLGLATDVKVPSEMQKQRMSSTSTY